MTNSNNSHNNSFIPVILLLISAVVIIATFYEQETKKVLASTTSSQTESVAIIEQHDSKQPGDNQTESAEKATSHDTSASTQDTTNSPATKTTEIEIAHADTAMVTEGNGNNHVNGSTYHDKEQSNEENTAASTPLETETKAIITASAPQNTRSDANLNITQNTVSNTAATQHSSVRDMPMPPHTYHAPHHTMHNQSVHPANMSAATANKYTPGYAPHSTPGYAPRYTPRAYNVSRQQPARPQMSMAQRKEAAMAYQANMEQRHQAMMQALQAQRLENNARIQAQLKHQAQFLAEMKHMQKIAFQRAEENRRRTMQKIQEINQRYTQLHNQVNKLNAKPNAASTDETNTSLTQ